MTNNKMMKKVNVYASRPITELNPPIRDRVRGAKLSVTDIRTCIMARARVEEILKDGSILVLNLSNYNKDNNTVEEVVAPTSEEIEEVTTVTEEVKSTETVKVEIKVPAEVVEEPVEETETVEEGITEVEIESTPAATSVFEDIPGAAPVVHDPIVGDLEVIDIDEVL